MRKKLLGVSLVVILLSLMAYGTYAYLTVEARTTNVITTGTIDISLIETTTDADGNQVAFPKTGISNVVPGKSIDKLVTVDNVGTGVAWIRVGVTSRIEGVDGSELALTLPNDKGAALLFDINTEKWVDGEDGYYYYVDPVNPEESTEQLFSQVTFNPAMGNEYQNCTAFVDVVAEAIQVKNNGDAEGETYLDAYWPNGPVAPAVPEIPVEPEVPDAPADPDDSGDPDPGTAEPEPEPTVPEA